MIKYILGLSVAIAIAICYYRFDPEMYAFFPACPFHRYLGLDCPGCGSQRAVHALLHGHIQAAADYNLLLVMSLPFLLIHFVSKSIGYFLNRDLSWKIWYQPIVPKIIFIAVLLFWVVRNIPASPFTYLAS